MDLLKTILIYLSLVYATSVQNAPQPSFVPTPEPTVYVQAATATPAPTPVPTINITPNPGYKTIQVGDNGELVLVMQEKLAEYGYYTGELDGKFGNQTRAAVEKFQYAHGLSADGIAGRATLTVLYESPEIRPGPALQATPSPTPPVQLSVAITPEPTPVPTPEPTVKPTFEPIQTATPTPEPTAAPAAALEKLENMAIVISGSEEPLAAEGVPLVACRRGEEIYLPLQPILQAAGLNVIATTSIEKDEFAFAIGMDLYQFSYSQDQAGNPVDLEAYKNTEPQILPLRDVQAVDGMIYLPASSVERLCGIRAQLNEESITIILPQ